MANIKIFENWTFKRPLPEPFASEAARTGKRYTTEPEYCSAYNHMRKGKRATLHGPTLDALLYLSKVMAGEGKGAFGIRKNRIGIENYCCEYVKTANDGSIREVRALIYLPETGIFRGCISCDINTGTVQPFQQICDAGGCGKELLLLLAYASFCEGSCYDEEFDEYFKALHTARMGGNEALLIKCGYILCDNLYRRIMGGNGKLKIDEERLSSGTIDFLNEEDLKKKRYNATQAPYGTFMLLNYSQ